MLSTRSKMTIARVLNRAVVGSRRLIGRGPMVEVARRGVNWRLDLNEGIDLAVYFNVYQSVPPRVVDDWIRDASVILDIGANVGAISLRMARESRAASRVVSIEPTDYAFGKLLANLELNPDLRERVVPVQAALTDSPAAPDEGAAAFYSRWPLDDAEGRHRLHQGISEVARGARFVALDVLLDELRSRGAIAGPVSFVKLDVDGNELAVLQSAQRLLAADHPPMLIEIAPGQQDEVAGRFERLLEVLSRNGYVLEYAASGKDLPMTAQGLRDLIPAGSSLDALARVR
jgi:FkbM family methyltransferase